MKCSKCGAELRENAKFCTKCGAPVETVPTPPPEQKKKTPMVPILLLCVIIVAAVVVIAYTLIKPEDETGQIAAGQTEPMTVEETTESPETVQSEETAPRQYEYTLNCIDGALYENLEGVSCTFTPADGSDSTEANTSSDGICSVTLYEGEYRVNIHKDGYYTEQRTIQVTGDGQSERVIMVAALDSTRWMVLVEWNGDRDVDISLFNAQTNVYTDIFHSYDESGSFLYADNDADKRYEMISYREADGVFTVFVKDYTAMLQGNRTSTMLSDGVTVKVYSPTEGLTYTVEGSHDQNTVVWNPLYFYDGKIEALDSYIFDIEDSDNAWIWQTKQ